MHTGILTAGGVGGTGIAICLATSSEFMNWFQFWRVASSIVTTTINILQTGVIEWSLRKNQHSRASLPLFHPRANWVVRSAICDVFWDFSLLLCLLNPLLDNQYRLNHKKTIKALKPWVELKMHTLCSYWHVFQNVFETGIDCKKSIEKNLLFSKLFLL